MPVRLKFSLIALSASVVSLMFTASAASAADLSLPVSTVIYADEGSLIELGRVPVEVDLAGPLCTWEASVTNQASSHPGNDILVISGDSTLMLSGVEEFAGKVTSNSGPVYLVDEVVVVLRMGPDEVFSGGLDLTIRYDGCGPVPTTETPTTTVLTIEVTTTTVPTTADSATVPTSVATTAPPPAGPEILPVTGTSRLASTAATGLALLVAGVLLIRVALRSVIR